MKIKTSRYTALFQKEKKGGYTVIVPLLPGLITYGSTLEKAKEMAEEAIELYIESLKAHKEEIPSEDDVFYTQIQIDPLKVQLSYA